MEKEELLASITKTINSNADVDTKVEDIAETLNRYHEELAERLRAQME